jgi:hypothetical protein
VLNTGFGNQRPINPSADGKTIKIAPIEEAALNLFSPERNITRFEDRI